MRIKCLMEVTWKLGNTYLKIQDCESGWDFTILDFLFSEIDGRSVEAMKLGIVIYEPVSRIFL